MTLAGCSLTKDATRKEYLTRQGQEKGSSMSCDYHETRWYFVRKDGTQWLETISVEIASVYGNDPNWILESKQCWPKDPRIPQATKGLFFP
jgi:hypothetical protein